MNVKEFEKQSDIKVLILEYSFHGGRCYLSFQL